MEMEQMMERLLAEIKILLKVDQEEMIVKMKVNHEDIMAIMGADEKRRRSIQRSVIQFKKKYRS
jgi:hypothetical protein